MSPFRGGEGMLIAFWTLLDSIAVLLFRLLRYEVTTWYATGLPAADCNVAGSHVAFSRGSVGGGLGVGCGGANPL